ncbi:DUF1836 domain-containing protein [Vagococcus elongatus]|nr:DUF1836 domain-containing protein [Vagococcus elongatus]
MQDNQISWQEELRSIRLPRWSELPDIPLYMDQLVTLVSRYVQPFQVGDTNDKALTPNMVNNYVKKNYILAPEKKRYDQRHLARLIIILILKQSFDLPTIHLGIQSQIEQGDYKQAYDQFCKQLEDSIALLIPEQKQQTIEINFSNNQYRAVQMATLSLAAKFVAAKALRENL